MQNHSSVFLCKEDTLQHAFTPTPSFVCQVACNVKERVPFRINAAIIPPELQATFYKEHPVPIRTSWFQKRHLADCIHSSDAKEKDTRWQDFAPTSV